MFLKFCNAGTVGGGVECEFGNERLYLYKGLCGEVKFELFHVLGCGGPVSRLDSLNRGLNDGQL